MPSVLFFLLCVRVNLIIVCCIYFYVLYGSVWRFPSLYSASNRANQCNPTHDFHMLLLRRYQIYLVTWQPGWIAYGARSILLVLNKLGHFVTFSLQTGQYATLFYWDWHFVSETDQMYSSLSSYSQVGLLLLHVYLFSKYIFERCNLKY